MLIVLGAGNSLGVSWTPPAADATHGAATGFNLRSTPAGTSTWAVVAGVSSVYTLNGLTASTAYNVQIQAFNTAGTSGWSATTTLSTANLAPNTPAALSVAPANSSSLSVTWTAPASDGTHGAAVGYNLRYSLSGAGTWAVVTGVSSVYPLTGLTAQTAYDVQIQASNAAGTSGWSASATAATGTAATSPLPPNAPTIASVAAPPDGSAGKLVVTWPAPASDASHNAATGFDLRYGPAGAGTWTTVTGVTSPWTIAGVGGAASTDVEVRATNAAASPSAWSAIVTGLTWGATVTAGPWIAATTQVHGTGVAPNGGAQLVAAASPASVTGAAFAWSVSNTQVPSSGLIAAGADGQSNGWGQWFNTPASAGTYYLWMLAQGAGGITTGALVSGAITVT